MGDVGRVGDTAEPTIPWYNSGYSCSKGTTSPGTSCLVSQIDMFQWDCTHVYVFGITRQTVSHDLSYLDWQGYVPIGLHSVSHLFQFSNIFPYN